MFETERCKLQIFGKEDISDAKKLFINHDVRKYLGGIRDVDSIEQQLNHMVDPNEHEFYWTIREKHTEMFIGLVSLDPHHDGEFLELSYQLLPEWWGRSFAAETLQSIIHFAFHTLNQTKLIAETQTANERSCKLLERLGMTLERRVIRFGAEQAIYSIGK